MHELSILVDRLEAAEQAIKEWFELNMQPKLDACTTLDEVRDLQSAVSYYCRDAEGGSRCMPKHIFMQFCLKTSLFMDRKHD